MARRSRLPCSRFYKGHSGPPLPKKLTSLMPSHQTKIPTLANVPKHPSRSLLT